MVSQMNKQIKFAIGYLFEIIIGIGNLFFISRILPGPAEYGYYSNLELISSYMIIMLGLGRMNAFIRYYYEKIGSKAYLLKICLRNTFYIFIATLTILLILNFKFWKGELVLIALIYSFIIILNSYILEILKFENSANFFIFSKILIKSTLIMSFGVVYFYKINIDYKDIFRLNIVINVFYLFIIYFIYLKKWNLKNKLKDKLKNEVKNEINKKISKYSYPYILTNLISVLFVSGDRLYIIYFLKEFNLGIYSMAYRVVAIFSVFYIVYSGIFTPIVLKKYYEISEYDLKIFLKKSSERISFIMISMGLLYCLVSPYVLNLLLTKTYSESRLISDFLIFGPIFNTLGQTVFYGIILKERPKHHLYISIISTFISLGCNIIFGSFFGLRGVALGTALTWVIFYFLCKYYSNKIYYIEYNKKIINLGIIYLFLSILIKEISQDMILIAIIQFILILSYGYFFREIFFEIFSLKNFKKIYIVKNKKF